MAAVGIGIVLWVVASDVYASQVTGVYQDRCDAGWYGAYAGGDHRHACYPTALDGLYELARVAVVLIALGSAASFAQQLVGRCGTPANSVLLGRGAEHARDKGAGAGTRPS